MARLARLVWRLVPFDDVGAALDAGALARLALPLLGVEREPARVELGHAGAAVRARAIGRDHALGETEDRVRRTLADAHGAASPDERAIERGAIELAELAEVHDEIDRVLLGLRQLRRRVDGENGAVDAGGLHAGAPRHREEVEVRALPGADGGRIERVLRGARAPRTNEVLEDRVGAHRRDVTVSHLGQWSSPTFA